MGPQEVRAETWVSALEANLAVSLSVAKKHAYHSILGQFPDIGQDELIFQYLLYRALSQLVAWYAISCWVFAYLNSWQD